MQHKHPLMLLLLFVMTLSLSVQDIGKGQTNSRTLEGTVVEVTGVSRWAGIIVESDGRRYMVQLYNFDYPKSGPKVIGGDVMRVGTRVKVEYTRTEPWADNTTALNATRVIKLDSQTAPQNNPKQIASQQSQSAKGNLCYSDSGSRMGTDCILTTKGTICYVTQASVKYVGFKSTHAHDIGAEYQVTMDSSAGVNYASRIVFTGRVKPTRPCNSRQRH